MNIKQLIVDPKIQEAAFIGLILVLYIAAAPYRQFIDEDDVILGGILISKGQFPYIDWFSHHLPLPYFLASILAIVGGHHVLLMRILFMLLLAGITIWIYRASKKTVGTVWARIISTYSACMVYFFLGNMIIGETIVSYLSILYFYLLFLRTETPVAHIWPYLPLIAFLGIFSTLGFVPFTLVCGAGATLIAGYSLYKKKDTYQLKQYLSSVALSLLLLMVSIPTGVAKAMYTYIFEFNQQYYSQFHYMIGGSYLTALSHIFTRAISDFTYILTHISLHNLFPLTITIGALSYFLILLKDKHIGKAVLFLIALILISSRGGIAAPISQLLLLNPYAVFAGIATIHSARALWSHTSYWSRGSSLTLITALSISIATGLVPIINQYLNLRISNIYHVQHVAQTSFITPSYWKADILNSVTTPQDTVFVGPGDFYTQIYLVAKPASFFRFYEPWHAACPHCKQRFFSDLATTKPKVIYWKSSEVTIWWEKDATGWDTEMSELLQQQYTPLMINGTIQQDFYERKN